MYRPKRYEKENPAYIFEFIQQHPFATFVLQGQRLLGTHIPVLTRGDAGEFILFGHIANHNEQHQWLRDGMEALLIFQGPHAFVSSSWYKDKNISTWDYSAVHINVQLKIQDEEELKQCLQVLVDTFEQREERPFFYHDIPRQMLLDHLPHITGFWCHPFKTEAVAKLHQGYEQDDIQSVVEHLRKRQDALSHELSKDLQKEHGTED